MKLIYALTLPLFLCAIFTPLSEGKDRFSSPVEIIFHVEDENGDPVKGATVEGYFWSPYTHDAVGDEFNLRTDEEGNCLVRGKGYSSIAGVVQADGYYRTEFNISLGDKNVAREAGYWSLQETAVILKGIRNPISMYAKRVVVDIPEQNTPIGFDMEKGDWVMPYGKGSVSDFNVSYATQQEAVHQYAKEMVFSVPTPYGGFVVKKLDEFSTFVSDYDAPTDGYVIEYSFEQKRSPEQIQVHKANRDNEYFAVRTRVVTNDVGEIISANYSKIYGPIQYALWRNQKYLEFIYYFNPTPNDRNLEFDPQQNLFGKLPSGEAVYKP